LDADSGPAMATGVDFIVEAGVVVPGAGSPPLTGSGVAVSGGRLVELGPMVELRRHHPHVPVHGGPEFLLSPGAVNAHTHLGLVWARGLAHDDRHPVYDLFWPIEGSLTPELVGRLARVAVAESLLSGVTTIADHYFFAEATAGACLEVGARGALGQTVMTEFGPWASPSAVAESLEFVRRHLHDETIHPVVAPHAPDTVGEDALVELFGAAAELGVPVHLHLAQSRREIDTMVERCGRGSVRYLNDLGLLDQTVVAAHCMFATGAEFDIIAEHPGVSPVYCPTVHALLSPVLPAADLLGRHINVALGSDATPNDRYDVWTEARTAVTGQAVLTGRPGALRPLEALDMATVRGASALGLEGEIARLAPGMKADLVLWRTDTARMTPLGDPAAMLVTAAGSREVHSVWVEGRRVVEAGVLLGAEEAEVAATGRAAVAELLSGVA